MGAAALACCLLAGCAQGDPSSCSAPPPWQEANAKPGQPQAELAACLKAQAYDTRSMSIPLEPNAQGIVAQCEIRVDRLAGHVGAAAPDAAADQAALAQARADVTQYRQCPAR
jgi:outer membrane murein-binding lipoprotein Lpp